MDNDFDMESSFVDVIRTLNNPVRRRLLTFTFDNAHSINELIDKLEENKIPYGSRDSVYKHLELLVAAGLLEKFYDASKKALSYKNPPAQVIIDIENRTVETRKEEQRITPK